MNGGDIKRRMRGEGEDLWSLFLELEEGKGNTTKEIYFGYGWSALDLFLDTLR